jgi:hypothetical protein
MKLTLEDMDHQVQIINFEDPRRIINEINQYRPDFVHINYDDWVGLYPYIQYPCAVTTHFAYIERPEKMGDYAPRVFSQFQKIKPNVFGLSKGINSIYENLGQIPKKKLFLNPNGVNLGKFRISNSPKHFDKSIYLAKIDPRKRQYLFQDIKSLWYAGNIADNRFDQSKNYLGEWYKDHLYDNLTDYGNLVLLSDGEAHPLVCPEAFSAGLGVVISQWASANLDVDKEFITVIPEDRIKDISFVQEKIIENREYSIKNRDEILDYAKNFEWCKILSKYYLPNINKVIHG